MVPVSPSLVALFLVGTFLLSWYATWGVGRYWSEARLVGRWLRVQVGAGAALGAVGFTWVYLSLLLALATAAGYMTVSMSQGMFSLGYYAGGGALIGSLLAVWVHTRILAFRRHELGSERYADYGKLQRAELLWWGASNSTDVLGNMLDGLGVGQMSKAAMIGGKPAASGSDSFLGFSLLGGKSGGGKSGGNWSGGGKSGGGGGGGGVDLDEGALILLAVMLAVLAIGGGIITTMLVVRHADHVHAVDVTGFLDKMAERRE